MERAANSQFHILVVGRTTRDQDGIEIFLKARDIRYIKAKDGVEGLEVAEQTEIHLAIVDIMMPRMDRITTMTMGCGKNMSFRSLCSRRNRGDRQGHRPQHQGGRLCGEALTPLG